MYENDDIEKNEEFGRFFWGPFYVLNQSPLTVLTTIEKLSVRSSLRSNITIFRNSGF